MEEIALLVGYLIEGALSYVGGQLMKSAMGDATITDVQTWIRAAVAELEAFLSAKLDDLLMQQMTAELAQLKQNLTEYASLSPHNLKANRYLIEDADTHGVALTTLSFPHEVAFFVSTSAIAYFIYARWALYMDDKDHGHVTSFKNFMDEYFSTIVPAYQKILQRLDPNTRLKIVCDSTPGLPPQGDIPPTPGYYYCYTALDGQPAGGEFDDDTDEGRARNQAQAYCDANIRPAIVAKFQDFQAKGAIAINLAAQAYEKMCKKVGGSYNPPVALPPIPLAPLPFPPTSTVLMPGAIILGGGKK
jgi:hypothetical protein